MDYDHRRVYKEMEILLNRRRCFFAVGFEYREKERRGVHVPEGSDLAG